MKKRKILFQYVVITLASVLYAVGLTMFIDPNDLAPGGVTGLAIIINRLVPLAVGTLYLIINIPIFILGMYKFGWRFICKSLWSVLITSICTNYLTSLKIVATHEPILAVFAGSMIVSIAMGIIFHMGGTSGGADIIVKIVKLRFPHLRTGVIFFSFDFIVVMLSGFIFQNADKAIYSAMAVLISAFVFDTVLYGTDEAKIVYIISDRSEAITNRLLSELDTGITHIQGRGAYSKTNKDVIMCAMRKQMAPKAEEIVKEEDENAFMIVTKATEVFGEGYKSFFSERL